MPQATAVTVRSRRAKQSAVLPGSSDLLSTVAQELAAQLGKGTVLSVQGISKALHRVLDGGSEPALRARTHLQQHLLLLSQKELVRQSAKSPSVQVTLLTTEQAAQLMGCSRPHVAMLIDTGHLEGAVRTPKGHRRVPLASVEQWLLEHPTVPGGTDTYREAGQEAGMYEVSVEDSAKAVKRLIRN